MDEFVFLNAYSHTALSVRLPGDEQGAARPLRFLEASNFTTKRHRTDGRAAPSSGSSVEEAREGAIFNCGGHVAALDWAPMPPGAQMQYLAVAAHPRDRKQNMVGHAMGGPALLQIWCIEDGLPGLAIALCLQGGIVWDCKWQPGPQPSHSTRLGLLAAAQGSGEISIFSIPDPADALLQQDRVRKGKARAGFDSAADKLIQLAPCASAAPESLSGSLVSCLEWLPSPPHDLLLVRALPGSDGSPQQVSMQLLIHFPVTDGPVRGLAWAPAELAGTTTDSAHRHLFAAVGHSLYLRVWDLRDSFRPVLQVDLPQRWRFSIQWLHDPAGLLTAEDEGGLRWTSLDPFFRRDRMPVSSLFEGSNTGPIWSIHIQPGGEQVFYAGDNGEVGVFNTPRGDRYVSADTHRCLAGVRQEGEQIRLLSATEMAQKSGLFGRKGGGEASQKGHEHAIHCVRCSQPVKQDQESKNWAWMAHGTAAGIVHIKRVSVAP